MNIYKLTFVNIFRNPLDSIVSIFLMSLGVSIISMMLIISNGVKKKLNNDLTRVDMVLGAKGSPLQLILSSIFHIDKPTGNINLNEAKFFCEDPLVDLYVPISYGDNFNNFRIVGSSEFFLKLYDSKISEGRVWKKNFEVVIGSNVANTNELEIGSRFYGSHGLSSSGHVHDDHQYEVVGVLEKTNSVIDNLIVTDTQSVWLVHNEIDKEFENNKMITSMLVKFKSPIGLLQIPRKVNVKSNMQAALPSIEISRLIDLLGFGFRTFNIFAFLIIIVSGLSILLNLYNSLRKRRYELAIMRIYGATKFQLARLILQESVLICIIATIIGFFISRLSLYLIMNLFVSNNNLDFINLKFINAELLILYITITVGILSSFLPIYKSYSIDPVKTITNA